MAEQCQEPLKVSVASVGSAKVVSISGSAGMAEADKLRTKLVELADADDPMIVLELSRMDFIGSLGLGALIVGHLHARRRHGQIRLVNPSPQVMGVLETANLTKVFAIYASVDQAVNG